MACLDRQLHIIDTFRKTRDINWDVVMFLTQLVTCSLNFDLRQIKPSNPVLHFLNVFWSCCEMLDRMCVLYRSKKIILFPEMELI